MRQRFRNLVPGEPIHARDENRQKRAVERLDRPFTSGAGLLPLQVPSGDGMAYRELIPAQWIVIQGGANPYSWRALFRLSPATTFHGTVTVAGWADHPDSIFGLSGLADGTAGFRAYEVNGATDVPAGKVVRAWLADAGDHLLFAYPSLSVGGTVTGDLTFASGSDSVYQSGSTSTFQSGSILTLNASSTLTTAATVSVTGGTWTYGSTASAGTAPTSRLVIPTLTGGAWPPTYVGVVGEILCGGDKFGQYTPTGWVTYSPDPLTTKGDLWTRTSTTDARLPVGTDGFLLKADSTQSTGLVWLDPATLSSALPTSPPAVTLGGTPTLSTAPQWFKVSGISRTDFSTAGTTRTITALVLPAKGVVHKAVVKTSAAFTGGAITAYKIDAKVNGNTVISVYDAFVAPSNTNFGSASEGNASAYLGKPWNFGATINVELTATSTGANLNAATAGALDLYLEMSKLE